MNTFIAALFFFLGFVLGAFIASEYLSSITLTIPADYDLVYDNTKRKCYGYPEFEKGRVWICDDGQIEYDETSARFPTKRLNDEQP